jgi:hypothetical protein
MTQKFTGILIDPEKKELSYVEYDGNYKSIYKLIEANLFDIVYLTDTETVFVDEEGLLNNPRYFFTYEGFQPLAGKGLILGTNDEGDSISTSLKIEDIKDKIEFKEMSVQGFEDFKGTTVRFGMEMPVIGSRPIFGPPDDSEDKA